MKKQLLPPRWMDRLLSWICKEEFVEFIQGDLHEIYQERAKKSGVYRANLWYMKDVFSVIKPRLLRKLESKGYLNGYGVFTSNLKTAFRNLHRNGLFASINIVGLAISMSVGLMMIVFLTELRQVDSFHEHKDRIYRLTTTQPNLFDEKMEHLATASYFMADQIADQIPEVERTLILSWNLAREVKTQDKRIALTGCHVTSSFFDVLSYELLQGHPQSVLENPGSVVLTTSAAQRLFGNQNPFGQTVEVNGIGSDQFVVTGLMKDPPAHSYLKFDFLLPMQDNRMITQSFRNDPHNTFENYVYLLLGEEADIKTVASKISMILDPKSPISHSLEPMSGFVTGAKVNANGPTFDGKKVEMMMALTIIVLLSACFNYTNLSLGRSMRRLREISVRKVTGATRHQIFWQFLTEAVLTALIALMLSIGLFYLARPWMLEQVNLLLKNRPFFTLEMAPVQLSYFLLYALVTGGMAGFFPALILSGIKASQLCSNTVSVRLLSGMTGRRALITAQFTLSIGLITCAVIAFQQYRYTLNFDLGFNTENIVNIRVQGDYMDLLAQESAQIPGVLSTTRSQGVLGLRGGQIGGAISEDLADTVMFSSNQVGPHYLDFHDFELISGSGFSPSVNAQTNPPPIVVNERFLSKIGLHDPEEAIGKKVRLRDENQTLVSIQGAVRNFMGMSLDFQMPEPFVFFILPEGQPGTLGLKVSGKDFLTTLTRLEQLYKAHDALHPFQAEWYTDQISANYQELRSSYTIITFLAILAVSIASLGLIGMAVYTTETRMKEISIRKVLGADIRNLILLLSKGFSMMIGIATMIAIPVAVHLSDQLILQEFLYRIDIGVIEVMSGLLIMLSIAIISVGSQIRHVARQKPAHLLRDE